MWYCSYMILCTQQLCENKHYAKGLCEAHYARKRRGYKTTAPIGITNNDPKRFMRYINKTDGCWLWIGSKKGRGYGKFTAKGKQLSAHRYSYELHTGKIKPGMQIDHLCKNKLCVNPKHLEQVTNQENQLRRFR